MSTPPAHDHDDSTRPTRPMDPPPADGQTLATPAPPMVLTPGMRLGKFRIEARLGEGGMGVVYKAMDERLERIVALKVLKPELVRDPQFAERFLREARSAARLNHPHVVTLYEADHAGGTLYLAFEFVTGGDLAQRIKSQGPLPCAEALRILIECAEGLQALHKAGLVHRDIKPQNIFMDAEGHAKLGDLGLARIAAGDDRMTVTGVGLGTPAYMSPEQVEGLADLDIRSDIHALGGTLYAMLTGKAPFDGATPFAITHRVLASERPHARSSRADLPEQVDALVLKAMAVRRDDRHATPVELVMDIRRVAGGQGLEVGPAALVPAAAAPAPAVPAPAVPAPVAASATHHPSTHGWLLPVAVVAVLVIAGGVAYGVMRHQLAEAETLRQDNARKTAAELSQRTDAQRVVDARVEAEARTVAIAERRALEAKAAEERSAEDARRSAAARLEQERRQAEQRQATDAARQADIARLRDGLLVLDRAEPIPAGAQDALTRLAAVAGSADAGAVRWQHKLDEVRRLRTGLVVLDQGAEPSEALRGSLNRLTALVGAQDADVARWSALFGPVVAWATAKGRDARGFWADLAVAGAVQRFRWCPPGTFTMGSPAGEAGRNEDEALHAVTLTQGFWLADSECSQGLWRALMGANPSRFTGDPQRPVEQVSWDDCQLFLQQLNRQVPTGQFTLPTEAQWEYACRAGTATPFSWGATTTPGQVNYDGSLPYGGADKGENRQCTVAVRTLPANPWGLHEMHGNVWEWCLDLYGAYPAGAVTDPVIQTGTQRVARGGSWFGAAQDGRAAARGWFDPATRDGGMGFRVAAR